MDASTSPNTSRLDPQRHATSPRLLAVVDEVARITLAVEAKHGGRSLRRRPSAMKLFLAGIDCAVANYAHLQSTCRDTFRVTRDARALASKSRYRPTVMSRQLTQAIDAMALTAAGFVTVKLGQRSYFEPSMQTEVTLTRYLKSRLEGMGTEDTSRRPDQEIVLLKKAKVSDAPAQLQEYDDTELTESYRRDVKLINAYLAKVNIDYTGENLVDTDARYLHRGFTNSDWFSGGRLSPTVGGAFWYPMSHEERLAHLLIEGERVASLDFKALGISLAYNNALGIDVPPGDPYEVPVALSRDQLKVLVSAMLFVEKLPNWPRALQGKTGGLKVAAAIEAVQKVHPELAPVFFTGIGHSLQHAESSILVDTMLKLINVDVPALPVHDCLYVPESQVKVARQAMVDAFSFHCNGRLPQITVEQPSLLQGT